MGTIVLLIRRAFGLACADAATGRHYEQFRWGHPPPSRKQFAYAMNLGVAVEHGMTKDSMSDAIESALAARRPARQEQLREIKRMHGVLPRAVSEKEADDVIDFLSGHGFACPYCGEDVCCADDQKCALCGKSLAKVKIPIRLP